MGNPLSPVIADLYMQHFEAEALKKAKFKPAVWYWYVDDTFVIWEHGNELLKDFLDHINSIHTNIQFTIETEEDDKLPFLDVLVEKKEDNTLRHSVYRKPTRTDRYLHANSHHHPAQKRGIIATLVNRALTITEPNKIYKEKRKLRNALNNTFQQ